MADQDRDGLPPFWWLTELGLSLVIGLGMYVWYTLVYQRISTGLETPLAIADIVGVFVIISVIRYVSRILLKQGPNLFLVSGIAGALPGAILAIQFPGISLLMRILLFIQCTQSLLLVLGVWTSIQERRIERS